MNNVLGEKQMNHLKLQKFESIMSDINSPKNGGRSIEKRIFQHDRSDKKLATKGMNSTQNLQNMTLKNIENMGKKTISSPQKGTNNTMNDINTTATKSTSTISKDDRKQISKLLIA